MYNFGSIGIFCVSGVFLSLGVLGHSGSKNQTRKVVKIQKDFEHQNVLIFSKYILFTKRIETFCCRDIVVYGVLGHFELYQAFMYNCTCAKLF